MRSAVLMLVLIACTPGSRTFSPLGFKDGVKIGYTECTPHGAFYWIRGDIRGKEELGVRAHEEKHIEQYNRTASCRAGAAWYLMNTAEAEAEAYCAHAQALAGEGPIGPWLVSAARALAEGYPELELTFLAALSLVGKYCAA